MTTSVRPAHITELPPASEMGPYADWCLANGESVHVGPLLLVPDTLLIAWLANGTHLPETVVIARDDGRAVAVYATDGLTGYPLHPTSE